MLSYVDEQVPYVRAVREGEKKEDQWLVGEDLRKS